MSRLVTCSNPSCDTPVSRKGARCPACAKSWRLARQRDRREAKRPAGPLPYPVTRELVRVLARMRDELDDDESDLQRLLDGDATDATVMVILQDVLRRTRARLTDLRNLTAEWETMNKEMPPRGRE